MPIALGEVGAAVVDGVLYVAGFGSAKVVGGGEVAFAFVETNTLQIMSLPDSFEGWQSRQFSVPDLEDPEKETTHLGPNVDLDEDGLPTLLEYLTNLNPQVKDAENAIPMNLVNNGQNLTLRYRKSKNAPDGSFLAQASTELFTWNRDGVTEEIIENLGEAWLMETTVPINDSNRKFVRLSGELIEEEL